MFGRTIKFLKAVGGVLKARLKGSAPFMVSHRLTARCNCLCDTCLWRSDTPVIEESDSDVIIRAYRWAAKDGILSATLWGGEPLLRSDILEICRGIRDTGITLGLITNGYLLPEKIEVCRHLDFLIVSLDCADERHNELRKKKGVFERAVAGIRESRRVNKSLKVLVNTVVSRLNGEDALGVAKLGKELGVGVVYESTNEGPMLYSGRMVKLRLSPEEEKKVFRRLNYLKSQGFPVINSYTYLRMLAGGNFRYRCHIPKISVGVAPDGSVTSCFDRKDVLGNFYEEPLGRIVQRKGWMDFVRDAERCCVCVDTGCAESSLFWDAKLEVFLNTFLIFVR